MEAGMFFSGADHARTGLTSNSLAELLICLTLTMPRQAEVASGCGCV
jgi:hypothetical protein